MRRLDAAFDTSRRDPPENIGDVRRQEYGKIMGTVSKGRIFDASSNEWLKPGDDVRMPHILVSCPRSTCENSGGQSLSRSRGGPFVVPRLRGPKTSQTHGRLKAALQTVESHLATFHTNLWDRTIE